jgi:hypothetical protein
LTFIYLLPIFISIVLVIVFTSKGKKEKFIGTDMWYGYGFQDANKTSKQDRTESLIRISKGYLPGERPKSGGLLENFENIRDYYRPRNYEIEPDYHRTVQQFGVDPNPIETLETPEFMIPKTYRNDYNYESLVEVRDNRADAIKLKGKESAFNHIEKNKYYRDLLSSKCRAGNRSSYKNCGCNAPAFGEH